MQRTSFNIEILKYFMFCSESHFNDQQSYLNLCLISFEVPSKGNEEHEKHDVNKALT
jgi:hypothetical protein